MTTECPESRRRRLAAPASCARRCPRAPTSSIVGGGLAGTALAYYLARAGVEVVLVERGELNREASGTNAGSFHFQIAIHQLTALETGNVRDRLQTEVRLHAEAAEVWKTLERELDGPLDIHITGGLMVAETAEELRLLHEKREIEQEAGLETHVLEGDELRGFAPYLADDLLGRDVVPARGSREPDARRAALRPPRRAGRRRDPHPRRRDDGRRRRRRRHAALHRHDRRRDDPRAPHRQRRRRLGERARGARRARACRSAPRGCTSTSPSRESTCSSRWCSTSAAG